MSISNRSWGVAVAAVLLAGLLVRLPFVGVDLRPTNDVVTYVRWARTIQSGGLENIYSGAGVNYPPLLLYAFGAAAALASPPTPAADGDLVTLIKLISLVCDLLTAGLIAWALRKHEVGLSIVACALYALNPAIWYVSAIWGQTDSVYALLLVASIVALERDAVLVGWLFYGLALATKPQSLAVAPVLIVWTFAKHGGRRLLGGLVVAAAVLAILAAPWLVSGHFGELGSAVTFFGEPSQVDASAFNLWYLLFLGSIRSVSADLHPAGLPLSYEQIGILLFGLLAVGVAVLVARKAGGLALPSAVLSLGLFVLLTQMHERRMYPALAFVLLAAAQRSDRLPGTSTSRGLWVTYGLLSLTLLFNSLAITSLFTGPGTNLFVTQDNSAGTVIMKGLAMLAVLVNILVLGWLVGVLARNGGPSDARG